MATELLALAAGADSAGKILTATDRRNMEFLDVLIENEQKEVIAHTVVQRYLQVSLVVVDARLTARVPVVGLELHCEKDRLTTHFRV